MNEFYLGDARQGLQRLAEQGRRVQLCYLDPPYLTGRDFGAYCDRFPSDEDYYAMMRAVLQGVYEVLDARGSLFLHIDWRTHARLRLLLEEIFGAEGFRNEIVWCYRSGGRAQTHFSRKHDTLLFFAKSRDAYFDAMQDPLPRAEVRSNHMKRGVDEDGRAYRAIYSGGRLYRYFDDEGVPSATHTVVEDGVFRTFLHNLKTARKDGVATTGNARKVGYASAVYVTPTNFYLKPGKRTLDDMLRGIGEGLVITEVSGLHAGANPISGDFSLLAKGYTFREGRREKPVEQITVAGNFYELLSAVRELASDLTFPMGGIGCPSVDVGELSVSGT